MTVAHATDSRARRRVPRWAVVLASLVALYTLFGFVILPRIIRAQMLSRLPGILHRPVAVREVLFNPYAMSITIRGLLVQEKDGSPLVAFEELYVDVAVWKHVFGGVHLQEVRIVQPQVGVAIRKGGALSFADLLEGPPDKDKKPEPPPDPRKKPLVFELAHFELDRGSVSFTDENRARPFQARLEPLTFSLDGFTTEPQKNGAYEFKARLEPAAEFAWQGLISTTPLKSAGTVSITGIPLAQFGSYTEDSTQLRVTGGALGLKLKYTFDASQTPTLIRVEDGDVTLDKLRVDPPGRDEALVTLDKLALSGIAADVGAQTASLREVSLDGAHVLARRLHDGTIELAALAKPKTPPAPAPVTRPAASASTSTPSAPAKPWSVRLDALALEHIGLVWEDQVPRPAARVTVDDLALRFGPFTFPGDSASNFQTSMRINGAGGRFEAKGTTHALQGSADVEFALQKLAFAPFQPYVSQTLTASIPRGTLDVKGHASYVPATKGAPMHTRFAGDVAVDGFALIDQEGKELAGFERFSLTKLDTDTMTTTLDTVRLEGPRVHYRINADKLDNFATLLRGARPKKPAESESANAASTSTPAGQATNAAPPPASPAPAPAHKKGPEPKTTIKTIALDNLSFDFVDKSVQPPYSTKLTQFGGKVAPFTQPGLAKSRIDLAGKLDGARLLIAGTLRPAGKDTDADLVVSLAPWNLTPTTPYGIKFAGYPVEKGKLSLDLKYKVGQHKLNASNLVIINQLTLGNAVESPTATKLPVKLALAILTDRTGKLEIDLPIEGSLDDPDFRFGKVVVRTLLNVLEKAATAPFALLGSLFGSSEDMSALDFASGSDDLAPAEQKKLQALAKALIDRPALRLSITGLADPQGDREGLLRAQLEESLLEKHRATVTSGARAPAAANGEEPALTSTERSAALRALFLERVVAPKEQEAAALRAAGKPVPPELVPRRDLPADQLEPRVLETVTLTADDFADLARSRAETVQDALSDVEGLDPERIFISTAKPDAPAQKRALLQLE